MALRNQRLLDEENPIPCWPLKNEIYVFRISTLRSAFVTLFISSLSFRKFYDAVIMNRNLHNCFDKRQLSLMWSGISKSASRSASPSSWQPHGLSIFPPLTPQTCSHSTDCTYLLLISWNQASEYIPQLHIPLVARLSAWILRLSSLILWLLPVLFDCILSLISCLCSIISWEILCSCTFGFFAPWCSESVLLCYS